MTPLTLCLRRRIVRILLVLPALLALSSAIGAGHAPPASAPPAARPAAVGLRLATERRSQSRDAQGHVQETWTTLGAGTAVQAGDRLRCTVRITAQSARPVAHFVLTQPVPAGLAYVAGSASVRGADGVGITFRADGADGFQAVPTVRVPQPDGSVKAVPAPPGTFRAVRWTWSQPLLPGQTAEAVFSEEVR